MINLKRKKIFKDIEKCPMRKGLKVLGGKWSLVVLAQIDNQNNRFGKLKEVIPDISEKMLITTLRTLEEDKLITKEDFFESPPRVEYNLTSRGTEALKMTDILISLYIEE